jgi:hypothetical protein
LSSDSRSQLDGAAAVEYAFPDGNDQIPLFVGYGRYRSSTIGDATLGQRIRLQTVSANFTGRVFSTGKIGVVAGVSYDRFDYAANGFNTNDRGALSLGLAYEQSPLTEYSLNLISSLGSSRPSSPSGMHVDSQEEALTGKIRISIASKLTGSVFVGAELARYRGAFHRSELLPVAGGELNWQVMPRGTVKTSITLSADFSPDGESSETAGIMVAYHQKLYEAWVWNVRIEPQRVTYHRAIRTREDNVAILGTGIAYEPSVRLAFYLDYSFRRQSSNLDEADFNRHMIIIRAVNRF